MNTASKFKSVALSVMKSMVPEGATTERDKNSAGDPVEVGLEDTESSTRNSTSRSKHRDTRPHQPTRSSQRQPEHARPSPTHQDAEFDRAQREYNQLLAHYHAKCAEVETLNANLHNFDDALREERHRAAAAERRLATTEDKLAARMAELEAVEAWLPATETVTDTQIIGFVNNLNYEITELATSLAEKHESTFRKHVSKVRSGARSSTYKYLEAWGATRLLELDDASNLDTATALQIAIQAALVGLASRFLADRAFDFLPDWKIVQDRVKEAEPEHVAVRWSTLAHKHVRRLSNGEVHVERRMTALLGDMMPIENYDQIKDRLQGLTRLLLNLDKVLGEKVTFGWMESFVIPCGTQFVHETMDEMFQSEGGPVICTTTLGLRHIRQGVEVVLVKPTVVPGSLLPDHTSRRR